MRRGVNPTAQWITISLWKATVSLESYLNSPGQAGIQTMFLHNNHEIIQGASRVELSVSPHFLKLTASMIVILRINSLRCLR